MSTLQRSNSINACGGSKTSTVTNNRFVFHQGGFDESNSNTGAIWKEHVKRQTQGSSTGAPANQASISGRKRSSPNTSFKGALWAGIAINRFKGANKRSKASG